MIKIRLFTDPHIGLNRTSHTTPESRARLRGSLVESIASVITTRTDAASKVFCLGDLYDRFDVDNKSLLEGLEAFSYCSEVIAGNHDFSNRKDIVSSLSVLRELGAPKTYVYPKPNQVGAYKQLSGNPSEPMEYWFIDHKLNQELFEASLDDAFTRSANSSLLFLHCNYETPFASQETTLNLTRDKAKQLLTKFSHIFIGHEHVPRTDLAGKVVILGNTHPTSFSDISDKFCYDVTIDKGIVSKIQSHKIWSMNDNYLKTTWQELSDITALPETLQFIDVVGEAEPQHMAGIAKQVADLWRMPNKLLMVRNNVSVVREDKPVSEDFHVRCESIPARISNELAGTKMGDTWDAYMRRI